MSFVPNDFAHFFQNPSLIVHADTAGGHHGICFPSKMHGKSLLLELRCCWAACKLKEKEAVDLEPWKSDLDEFLLC
jgi:hypothetical protein